MRERFAWIISFILIGILAFNLPGSLAHRQDDYAFVKTLLDVHTQVENNYVEPLDQQKLQAGTINGMLEQLDPYSIYIPAEKQQQFEDLLEGSFQGVGIELNQLENGDIQVVTPIPDSPALRAGVQAGDILVKVNGQDLHGKKIVDVQKMIQGPADTQVHLTVRHSNGMQVELTMRRQQIVMPTVLGYRRNPDYSWDYWVWRNPKVGYIRVTQFTSDTYKTLRPLIENLLSQGMQGLILDLRFNPGGRLDQAEQVVNLFINHGVIVKTRGLHRAEQIAQAQPDQALAAQFPLIVMVNEHSASAAEIVSGSLKDNGRALIVGTRTYGKGSVQEVMPLPGDEGELKLTIAYYYLPGGEVVQKKKDAKTWGVEPQILVPMSEEVQTQVLREQGEQELMHKPLPLPTRPATGPAASQASTAPATQPVVDTQLQTAVATMVGSIALHGANQLVPSTQKTGP